MFVPVPLIPKGQKSKTVAVITDNFSDERTETVYVVSSCDSEKQAQLSLVASS